MIHVQQYVPHVVTGLVLLFIVIRQIRLARDSKGVTSFSVTGIQVTLSFTLLVIYLDTVNDRPPQEQYQYSAQAQSTANVKTQQANRRVRTTSRSSTTPARMIIKEKYYLLGSILFWFFMFYLLGHRKELRDWSLKVIMALRKMNPHEHLVDEAMARMLQENPYDPKVQDFCVRMTLARQGKTLDAVVTATVTEPGPGDLVTAP